MAFPARPSLELPLVGGVQNETDSGFLPAYHENTLEMGHAANNHALPTQIPLRVPSRRPG